MKLLDVLHRSGRNLRMSKGRTLLTALAIGVGGFTLALTLAAGNGVREYTDKLVATNFDPAEMLVGRDKEVSNTGAPATEPKEYDESVSTLDFGGGGSGSLQVKRVTQQDIDEIKSQDYIENVRESYQISIRYVTREGQKRYTASAEAYNPAQKPDIRAGGLPKTGDITAGTIMLPESYLDVLGFKDPADALGKEVQVNVQRAFSAASAQDLAAQARSGASVDALAQSDVAKPEEKTKSFKIAGITKRPATSFSVGLLPFLISNQDARELYDFTVQGTPDYEKYMVVYARVKDGHDEAKIQAAKQDLESKGYHVQTSKDIQRTITQFVNILQIMVGVFGLITLVASVFGIINTQYISVLERTREIGLMKALGMRGRDVRRLFMFEATWIGFLGGVIGSLMAVALGTLLNPWITKKLELGEGSSLVIFDPLQLATMIGGLMLVATIAGLLPARKAAKMDPIEALRSE